MNFEEFARDSGKALADATAPLRPPSITEISSRRRRSALTAGTVGVAALLVGVVVVAGAINRGSTAVAPATSFPTETTMGAVEASVIAVDLLDGSRLEVVGPSDLVLTGYSFFLDRPELGGDTNVHLTRTDDPAEAAAAESAELEADLGSGVQLWRRNGEGQPLFMSVDLDGWVVFIHVGSDAAPNSEDLSGLAEELRGEVTDHGVILPNHDTDTFTTYLGSPETENSIHLGIGECVQELIPDSEIVEHPTRGEVIRGDTYASWCDDANDLEVRVHGDGGFVLHSVGGLILRRSYPDSQPTTISTAPPSTAPTTTVAATEPTTGTDPESGEVRWSAAGVGMVDAFFPDNRLLAASHETVFIADGWGDFSNDPRGVSALSATTGEVIWRRADLATDPSDSGLFIQLLTPDRLVVNGQDRLLAAIDPTTGETHWAFNLPEGYNASGAVSSGEVMYVGAHAPSEGAIQPPIAYAINLTDGSVIWETPLAEGTDLQPAAPALSDDSVLFGSTLSHPESADGNMIHAVSVTDGSILWELNLGGDQGFKFFPTLIHDEIAIVSGPTHMLGVSLDDGTVRWEVPNAQPLVQTDDGVVLGQTQQGIAAFSSETGEASLWAQVDWAQDVYRPHTGLPVNGQLVVSDGRTLRAFAETGGELLWSWAAPGVIVDTPILVGGAIAVPIGNQIAASPEDRHVLVFEVP